MLEDEIRTFIKNIYTYLFQLDINIKGLLVKKHSVHLKTQGEFSFPNNLKSWNDFIDGKELQNDNESLMKFLQKDNESLIKESHEWTLHIKKVSEIKDRLHIFLERSKAIEIGLSNSIINNERILNKVNNLNSVVYCDVEEGDNCVTSMRVEYLSKAIDNLCTISPTCTDLKIFVTSKSTIQCEESTKVLCGAVINSKTGVKEVGICAEDFIRIRQDELTLIAQHKYGVRVSTDSKWKEFIAHLGQSAVTFELLQIKPSSPVKIHFDASSGSSKSAAFVLYNCARLETMLRTFNDKVAEGTYPALPKFEDVDLSLLTDEDEWCLVFNYILGLPYMLQNCVEITGQKCDFRPHLICSFLSSMVRVFSQYYRKVRILTEPRKHLLPVLFARIYLLKSINDTLKICLRLLNIKSVSQMYRYFNFQPKPQHKKNYIICCCLQMTFR